MSFSQKSSQTKSVFPAVSLKNGSGEQPNSTLVAVNLKDGNGFTLSASQPADNILATSLTVSASHPQSRDSLPAANRVALRAARQSDHTPAVNFTLSACAEEPKVDFPTVNLKHDNGLTVPASEQQHVFPVVNLTDGNGLTVAASAEQLKFASPIVNLTNGNGLTVSASAEQPQIVPPAATLSTGNGSASFAFAEQPKTALPAVSVTNGNGSTLSAFAEQQKSVFPTVNLANRNTFTLSTPPEQPKPTFLGANLNNNNGSTFSASAEYTTCSFVTEQRTRTRTISGLGNRPIPPPIAETRTVIQKEEWLDAARRSTEYFRTHGSPVPLVWVLTEGNRIPDNAVPFGEDRNGCTLYIARAILEGSLHIGKASVNWPSGAVIGYAGKERIVTNYEVLVFASQLRWGFPSATPEGVPAQGTVVFAQKQNRYRDVETDSCLVTLAEGDIPRIIRDSSFEVRAGLAEQTRRMDQMDQTGETVQRAREDADSLKRLAEVKSVIVIDDSLSMQEGNLWEQAREALGGIVDIANRYGSNGADIHFMHWDDYAPNMQSKSEVDILFSRVLPEGEDTPVGAKLDQIINHYVPLIEDERSTHEPIVIVVITDGLPTDQAELDRVIVDVANRLDRHQVKHDMFRIQFVQIGTDPAASALLHILDNNLVNQYKIRDIVDCTPYDPAQGAFDTEYMLKIILGGLRKDLDRVGHNASGGQLAGLSPPGALPQYERSSVQGLTARLGNASPRPVSPRPLY